MQWRVPVASALAVGLLVVPPALGQGEAGEPRPSHAPSDFIRGLAAEIVNAPWKRGEAATERLRLRMPEDGPWVRVELPGGAPHDGCRQYETVATWNGIRACDVVPTGDDARTVAETPRVVLDALVESLRSAVSECRGGAFEVVSSESVEGAPASLVETTCPQGETIARVVELVVVGRAVHAIQLTCQGSQAEIATATPAMLALARTAQLYVAADAHEPAEDVNAPALVIPAQERPAHERPAQDAVKASGAASSAPPSWMSGKAEDERLRIHWRSTAGWKRVERTLGLGDCRRFEMSDDLVLYVVNACSAVPDRESDVGRLLYGQGAEAWLDHEVADLRSGVDGCAQQDTSLMSSDALDGAPSRLVVVKCLQDDVATIRVERLVVGHALHVFEVLVKCRVGSAAQAVIPAADLAVNVELCTLGRDEACPATPSEPAY